jgi:ankyrin repeat protein
MPTKRLPDRPSVEHLKKQAKQLVSAIGRGDEDARARVQEFLPRAASAEPEDMALADAQTVVAREYGFESWRRLRVYVDASAPRRNEEGRFAAAISAVINGEAADLRELLAADPALATARASAKHRATLLHYVSANAVEDGLQKTPPNAVEIADILLAAGADADATFQDGKSGSTPLVMLVTSGHPHDARLGGALVEAFVRGGASVDGLDGDGLPLSFALGFGYTDSAEALVRCGATVSGIQAYAGVGRAEPLEATLREGDHDAKALVNALHRASKHGREACVLLLLDHGADMLAAGWQNNTALHFAAEYGHASVVDLLVARGAALEAINAHGLTPLSAAVRKAVRWPAPGVDYAPAVGALVRAGASRDALELPTGIESLDRAVSASPR